MDDVTSADWYSEETSTFGDRIAGAREAMGLTPDDLARRMGIKLKTLQAWEDDLSEPRANRFQMLSGILNVSMRWLLTGEGEGIEPQSGTALGEELNDVLTEIRDLRADMARNAERLARLEKRLRGSLAEV
ncbi:MAG: helix-turn-helix domain-containing protein [Rhodobacteraceae bacterium]|nr:helix-turn-helix domain-containing protein [Paracoccaceae bacterium]